MEYRTHVVGCGERAAEDREASRHDVARGMGPGGPGTAEQPRNRLSVRQLPLNPGKIDARRGAQRDPGPRPWIDVEDLGAAVAGVEFEFDLDHAAEPQIGQEPA